MKERRKSVQFAEEPSQQHKLTRSQLDDLHKMRPSEIYYEKKVDEKPVFSNTMARNTYVRTLFKNLSEKKRKKLVLKATDRWREYLQANRSIVDEQIPTLHIVLTRNEETLHYFQSLGLPARPPISALILHNHEREQSGSQQYWADLPQPAKDEMIKRVHKMKSDYHAQLVEFVEKVLPSDYLRAEFFRHVKYASKDYEATTGKVDDKQLKITQYLKKKTQVAESKSEQFDRIARQLIGTNLNNEQKSLVDKLSKLMRQLIDETKPSADVVLLNGDHDDDEAPKTTKKKKRSADDASVDAPTTTKKKKKKSS